MAERTSDTVDTIILSLPSERRFLGVARLVVAGLATRLDLPYEQMDDLQLAVETILREHARPHDTAQIEIAIGGERIELTAGPLAGSAIGADGSLDGSLGGGRVLEALVEQVEVIDRAGTRWLRLAEPISPGPGRLAAR